MSNDAYWSNHHRARNRREDNAYQDPRYAGNNQQYNNYDYQRNDPYNHPQNNYNYNGYSQPRGMQYSREDGREYERNADYSRNNEHFASQRHSSPPRANYDHYESRINENNRNRSRQSNGHRYSPDRNRQERDYYNDRDNSQGDYRRESNSNAREHYGTDNRYTDEDRRAYDNRSEYSHDGNQGSSRKEYDEFEGRYGGLSFSRNRRSQNAGENRGGFYSSPEYLRAQEFEKQMEREYYERIGRELEGNLRRENRDRRVPFIPGSDLPVDRRWNGEGSQLSEEEYRTEQTSRDRYPEERHLDRKQYISDNERHEPPCGIPDDGPPPEVNETRGYFEETRAPPNVSPELSKTRKEYIPSPSSPSPRHTSPYSQRSGFTATPELPPSPTPKSDITVIYNPIQRGAGRQDEVQAITNSMQSNSISEPGTSSASVCRQREQYPTSSKQNVPVDNLIVSEVIPMACRLGKERVTLTTNMFPLEVKRKTIYLYDISMKVVSADGRREMKISKDTREKTQGRSQRDEICVAAMRAALEAYGLIRSGEASLYDGGSQFYSSEGLFTVLKPHNHVLTVSITTLPASIVNNISLPNAESIVIEFGRENSFDLQGYKESATNRDLSKSKAHKQFFDVLTSEPALASGKFTAFYNGKLFAKDARREYVGNGEEMFEGIKKGIAIIQTRNTGMVPALVLDSQTGHFYVSQNAIRTVCEMMGIDWKNESLDFPFGTDRFFRINQKINGIRFTINSDARQMTFAAAGISKSPIEYLHEPDVTGRLQPLFYAARFANADLSKIRKHWPAIELRVKFGNKWNIMHYPMEFLTVSKYQRVPIERVDGVPIKPKRIQDRFESISRMVNALNLQNSSPYSQITRAFGVSISSTPLKVEAIKRALPGVAFKQGSANPDKKSTTFDMQAYTEAASISDIVVCYDCSSDLVKKLGERLNTEAKALGMKISRWHWIDLTGIEDTEEKIQTAFVQVDHARQTGAVGQNPIIFYIDELNKKSHALLKFYERKHLIITQHVTTDVAEKALHGKRSRVNILNKLNVKLGGSNYSVVPDEHSKSEWITNGKTLIVGYDVAHPTGLHKVDILDSASVVGISFNGAANPEAFIGDYHYQFPRHEQVNQELLVDRMRWIMTEFVGHRKSLPENIFILRDGVSEGQYNMVLNEEFRALKDGIEEYKRENLEIPGIENWQPKYLVIVVCKRHNKRFAVEEKEGVYQNALPGTVVDNEAVRSDMTHFYLLPHKTYQGTAKMPSYHVLLSELDCKDQDKLQSLLFSLSFNHQISPNSTSLPEPVYQADEWAKRGHENFKVFRECEELPRLKTWDQVKYSSAPIDYEKLTDLLCYRGTRLEGLRLNA